MDLCGIAESIRPLDEDMMSLARRRQDSLTKPRGSLGRLEDISVQLAGIYRTGRPVIAGKAIFTMAGDHGVTKEGISAYPSDVTAQMVLNFASGGAAINVLGRHAGADVITVDMGVAGENNWPDSIVRSRIRGGTGNLARENAMTLEQAGTAVANGIELARSASSKGYNLIGIGDMGIGNTTSASAITAVVTGQPVRSVTGLGTGIDSEGFDRKIATIAHAIEFHRPDPEDPLDLLSKVGGLEIAGMAGVILGAASMDIPVVLDGFISGSSALIAAALAPNSREYMIASHLSVENGHGAILKHIGLEPLLDMRMRLGEGTGAALAMMIIEGACKVLDEMATFEEAGVSDRE